MINCNNDWVYIKLINEKIFLRATSETYQEENKKIYWKQFEYTDLGQSVNISKHSREKPGFQLQPR